MMKRPFICEEPSIGKGVSPCHMEAKSFCTLCGTCVCNNHSTSHENTTCPKLLITLAKPSEEGSKV